MTDTPEPCTYEAYEQGCTCSIPIARSTDIDPPEPRINRRCPLHGDHRDPDDLREQRREDREFFRSLMDDGDV